MDFLIATDVAARVSIDCNHLAVLKLLQKLKAFIIETHFSLLVCRVLISLVFVQSLILHVHITLRGNYCFLVVGLKIYYILGLLFSYVALGSLLSSVAFNLQLIFQV